MGAKNHLLVFSSFLDIWENVEWPRFFWTTLYVIKPILAKALLHSLCLLILLILSSQCTSVPAARSRVFKLTISLPLTKNQQEMANLPVL